MSRPDARSAHGLESAPAWPRLRCSTAASPTGARVLRARLRRAALTERLATCDYGDDFAAVVQHGQLLRHAVPPGTFGRGRARMLANFLKAPRRHGADPRHRSARRALRAPAQGRLRRRDALTRRPARAAAALIARWARTGCTSSISTARATARSRTAASILRSPPQPADRAPGGRRRPLGGRRSTACCGRRRPRDDRQLAVDQPIASAWLARTYGSETIVLALDVRHDAAGRPRCSRRRLDQTSRGSRCGSHRALSASRSDTCCAPTSIATARCRAQPRCTPKAVRASRDCSGRLRAVCATRAISPRWRAVRRRLCDQRQGPARRTDRSLRSCGHSCQTHHPLPRRPRRPGRQGRALPRSPDRGRHPRARRALSRRGRGRARVLRHHRESRGAHRRPQWVRRVARILDIPFCVAGGIRTRRRRRSVLKAGAEKISINSPASPIRR